MGSDDSHRPQIEIVVRHILEHIDEPLTLSDVADVAKLSEFHFHRLFSSVMGEPVGRFITRKRLELAALRIAYEPHRSITDVARACGYSSISNFSKAFAGFFGCSPSQVRRPQAGLPPTVGRITRMYGKVFRPIDLYSMPLEAATEEQDEEYATTLRSMRLVTTPGFDLCCLAGPGGYELAGIEQLWRELIERVRTLGLAGQEIDAYGVVFDSPQLTAPELCRYHACVPCPPSFSPPTPLFLGRIPAGTYAIFPFCGSIEEMAQHYKRIYCTWLPRSEFELGDFSPIDRYVGDFPVHGKVALETWIRVHARA